MALTLNKLFNFLPVEKLYVVAQIRNGAMTDKIYIESPNAAECFFEILRLEKATHQSACVFIDLHIVSKFNYKVFRTYDLGENWDLVNQHEYKAWYGCLFDIYHTADEPEIYEELLSNLAGNEQEEDIVF